MTGFPFTQKKGYEQLWQRLPGLSWLTGRLSVCSKSVHKSQSVNPNLNTVTITLALEIHLSWQVCATMPVTLFHRLLNALCYPCVTKTWVSKPHYIVPFTSLTGSWRLKCGKARNTSNITFKRNPLHWPAGFWTCGAMSSLPLCLSHPMENSIKSSWGLTSLDLCRPLTQGGMHPTKATGPKACHWMFQAFRRGGDWRVSLCPPYPLFPCPAGCASTWCGVLQMLLWPCCCK